MSNQSPQQLRSSPMISTINGGSSSINFVVCQVGEPLERKLYGKIDRIGLSGTTLTFNDSASNHQNSCSIVASDHKSAATFLMDWLTEKTGFESVGAVGHWIVHGMQPSPWSAGHSSSAAGAPS